MHLLRCYFVVPFSEQEEKLERERIEREKQEAEARRLEEERYTMLMLVFPQQLII